MTKSVAASVLAAVSLFVVLSPWHTATAQAVLQTVQECTVGKRVQTSDGHTGTIARVDRSWSYCYVRQDDTGKEVGYLYSLLSSTGAVGMSAPPGGSPSGAPTLDSGVYECWADREALFMNFSITGAGTYASGGKSGSYQIEPSGKVVFRTGPFTDVFAKVLSKNRIGLNMNGDSFYETTCDLNRSLH